MAPQYKMKESHVSHVRYICLLRVFMETRIVLKYATKHSFCRDRIIRNHAF